MKCTHISDRQIDNGHLDEKKHIPWQNDIITEKQRRF